MLKQEITYEDYNGDTVTEPFYFNLNKSELIELSVSKKGGFEEYLKAIIKSDNGEEIVGIMKKIILMAYGEKSDDGKRFVKNDTLREEFSQTAAYNELFMKCSTDSDFAAKFIIGMMPKDLADELKKEGKISEATLVAPSTPQNEENQNV